MLSLVASIHLNKAMENDVDREKKGGDHSLSLAYVRATILELRKKVDKEWLSWVEEEIEWIRSNPSIPSSGKGAEVGVCFFQSVPIIWNRGVVEAVIDMRNEEFPVDMEDDLGVIQAGYTNSNDPKNNHNHNPNYSHCHDNIDGFNSTYRKSWCAAFVISFSIKSSLFESYLKTTILAMVSFGKNCQT